MFPARHPPSRNGPGRRVRPGQRLCCERLEDRTLLSGSAPAALPPPETDDSPAQASPLALGATVNGTIDRANDVDYFALHVDQQGYLQATVTPRNGSTLASRLAFSTIPSYALFKELVEPIPIGGGGLLAESDGGGPGNPNPQVAQIVLPGDYFLAVSASGAGGATGDYTLATHFLPASDPNAPQPDPVRFVGVGQNPMALVTGDFNGDGVLDLATADQGSGTVSVLLGGGDGTFQPARTFAVPDHPTTLVLGDFNGDGRPDLATLDGTAGTVSVLLGIGDGNFRLVSHFPLPGHPDSLVTVDSNHDGHLDLAALDSAAGTLTLLPGAGDGTFAVPDRVRVAVPLGTDAVAFGDFRGSGHLDLAALDSAAGTVAILPGTADGQFAARPAASFAVPDHPTSIVSADFYHDGRLDLATLDVNDVFHGNNGFGVEEVQPGVVSVFRGRGDGTFDAKSPAQFPAYDPAVAGLFNGPATTVFADYNRDGTPDLASLISQNGDGQAPFSSHVETASGISPQFRQAMANVPGIGLIDVTHLLPQNLFLRADTHVANPAQATPLFADLTGAGVDDAVVVSRSGDILFRAGVPGQPGAFGAPVIINDPARGDPRALAVALIADGPQARLAAIDLQSDTVSIYSRAPDGTWTRTEELPTGLSPVRIAAADLDGDRRKDLVVVNSILGSLSIYLQQPDGSFVPAAGIEAGTFSSDVVLADVNGDGRLDILVTDKSPGDVGVFLNEGLPAGQVGFAPELRFRGGAAVHATATSVISVIANSIFQGLLPGVTFPPLYFGTSHDETGTVAVGDFTGDGIPDLVTVNTGSNTFALLRGEKGADGKPTGGFLDPVLFDAGDHPTAVVAGDFNGDGNLDLAVLDEGSDEIEIFLGDGQGGFTQKIARDSQGNPIPLQAGLAPTGLSVHRRPDGVLDLVVGSEFGDLLTLQGAGDGTFMPYKLDNGRAVSLAVADLGGGGQDDLILGSQAQDRIVVENQAQQVQDVVGDREHGLLAPRVGTLADLNGDGIPDLVVANTGANDVLVYLGEGNGQFASTPQEFFVGTHPVGVTIADVNGDGIPDLVVANEGSNDVSILLGQGQGGAWTLVPGPRLRAGAAPVATVVEDVSGHGVPDILVANSGSDNVSLLPGLGNGFFDDRPEAVQTFATGSDPQQVLVGHFLNPSELDLLTVNAGSNNLTLFPDFGPGRSLSSGGDAPVAAVAGDFSHNGLTDLLVANSGDGLVSLLMGGENGPSLAETFSSPDLLHPTALALSPGGDALYVADEDRGSVTRFDLGPNPASEGVPAELPAQIALTTLTGVPGTSPLTPESGGTLAAVPTALKESPVPLVAILVTGLPGEGESARAAVEAGEAAAGAVPAAAAGGGDEGPEREGASADRAGEEGAAAATDAKTGLLNFLGGVDDAAGKTGPGPADPKEGPASAEPVPPNAVPPNREQNDNDPQPPDEARAGPQDGHELTRRPAVPVPARTAPRADVVVGRAATAPPSRPGPARSESRPTQEWVSRLAALVCAAVGWGPWLAQPAAQREKGARSEPRHYRWGHG
jgi:hypothetical protein